MKSSHSAPGSRRMLGAWLAANAETKGIVQSSYCFGNDPYRILYPLTDQYTNATTTTTEIIGCSKTQLSPGSKA